METRTLMRKNPFQEIYLVYSIATGYFFQINGMWYAYAFGSNHVSSKNEKKEKKEFLFKWKEWMLLCVCVSFSLFLKPWNTVYQTPNAMYKFSSFFSSIFCIQHEKCCLIFMWMACELSSSIMICVNRKLFKHSGIVPWHTPKTPARASFIFFSKGIKTRSKHPRKPDSAWTISKIWIGVRHAE